QVRSDAERCVPSIGLFNDEVIAGLKENLSNQNHFVSAGAVSVLGGFADHSEAAFIGLIGAMGLPDRGVKQQSKYRLIDAAKRNSSYLVQILEDSDALVRYRALTVLYEIAQPVPESVPVLVKLLDDQSPNVSSFAADVLWLQDRN